MRAMKTRTPILTSVVLVLALGACSPPGASTVPLPSVTVPSAPLPSIALPSVPLPSVDASAAASAAASLAAGAALAALDQVDAAITANTSASGLSTDDATLLKQLTAGVRTALQSGDNAGARAAVDDLSTKAQTFATKLGPTAGPQLIAAIAALKAAIPS